MPPIERDAPRDLRHSHSSSSDHGRALVPMWDSSDPERAPPPLPLNPQSPSFSSPSRPGTSVAIQSAHAALTEKARDSALVTGALTKRGGETSPERSLIKNSAHRRMQSLQPSSVRDLGFMLEGGRDSLSSTPRSPEKSARPGTPSKSRDPFIVDPKPEDKESRDDRALTLSMSPGPSLTPIIRPIARRTHQSILGENTPPQSATMLALQNMTTPTRDPSTRELPREPPRELPREPIRARDLDSPAALSNITNGSTALVRTAPPIELDSLSKQILSLTSIATALQKEMSQLSRRSRDNATDLLSLKEATNTRDEDIRKSLRDLLVHTNEISARTSTRDPYGASLLLDNKPHNSHGGSPLSKAVRPFSLPRIPSPNSFSASLDGDRMSTPSLCSSGDGPATVALLEKIVRDMGTKEGYDTIISRLSQVQEKLGGMATAEKIEELVRYIKTSQDQAVVFAGGSGGSGGGGGGGGKNGGGRPRTFSFDEDKPSPQARRELDFARGAPMSQRVERLLHDGGGTRRSSAPAGEADMVSEDILKVIRTVKDSVAQGGGLTAEVKALVRELRGEVLGMGREIGRRLDEVSANKPNRSEEVTKAEMNRVIEEGLGEMKQHMNQLLREHRRQSAAAAASRAPTVDYKEVYNTLRAALKDSQAARGPKEEYSREDVMRAVKEAWEMYKPEIQVEQIGLERDEVLECLKEGLREYAPRTDVNPGATRDEVFKAVVEGLRHFTPPQVETPASLSRDEILEAVRECLEEFEFPVAPSAMGAELTKQDMVDAVKQGLDSFEMPLPEMPLVPAQAVSNDEVMLRLREIMDYMREEFKAVSEEAKQNVAANGRDTEQVLDATKDGFDKLRAEMEGYVDRASGLANQEGFLDGLVRTLDLFREEIAELVSKSSDSSRELIQGEIESLRETVNTSLVPMPVVQANHNNGPNNKEVLEALQDGMSSLRAEFANRPIAGTNEVLDALQEGVQDLRLCIERYGNKPADLTGNDEILDALKTGLDGVKSELDGLRDNTAANDKAVATLDQTAIVPVDVLKHDDIKNLEVLITQLRIKVEALETQAPAPPPPPAAAPESQAPPQLSKEDVASKEDLSALEEMLRALQDAVTGIASSIKAEKDNDKERPLTDPATREDVVAIETILRNTKARLDDLIDGEQAVQKDHVDSLEAAVLETKEALGGLKTHLEGALESLSCKDDIKMVESLIAQVANEFEEMKDRHDKQFDDPERVTKTDVDALEAVCLDIKSVVEQMVKADLASLPNKEDLADLGKLVAELKDKLGSDAEATAKAFEERQAETVGVGERVAEVKTFLEEFSASVKSRLEQGATGVETLGKFLESLGETVGKNANVSHDLKEMFEAIKSEFEESRAGVVGAKLEADEKFQQTTDTIGAKIDERIADLLTKYDEFQLEAEERAKSGEARDEKLEAAALGTKAVADELKTLIDTLGSAVTDSLEKMEEASKTVFNRVEELVGKTDEGRTEDKAEHQMTRDEVKRAAETVEGLLQGQVVEYQPKILEGIKDVLLIVGQHFEHSKSSTETIREKIEEAKPPELPQLPPPEKYDDSQVMERLDQLSEKHVDGGKLLGEKLDALAEKHDSDQVSVREKLEQLLAVEKYDDSVVREKLELLLSADKYDDGAVRERLDSLADKVEKLDEPDAVAHEKLDRLVDHSTSAADKTSAQLETLDKVHMQVLETAAEMSRFITSQTRRIADEHEDRERELHEARLALERASAEREHLDASIAGLRAEEEGLRLGVAALRLEKESLSRQRTRLVADLSSLETAVHLRREEMREVEERAQALERRILEGVMDHSRVLLMARAGSAAASSAAAAGAAAAGAKGSGGKGRDAMSRKRVTSQRTGGPPAASPTQAAEKPAPKKQVRTVVPTISMALSKTAAKLALPVGGGGSSSNNNNNNNSSSSSSSSISSVPVARRIVSLSQMNHNLPAGGFKRSQSVRNPNGRESLRKSSWAGDRSARASPAPTPSSAAAHPVQYPAVQDSAAATATATAIAIVGKAYGDLAGGREMEDREDKENSAPLSPPPRLDELEEEEGSSVGGGGSGGGDVSMPRVDHHLQPQHHQQQNNNHQLALASTEDVPDRDEEDGPTAEEGEDDHSDTETLRRSSLGTTVITESEGGTYDGSEEEEDDDDDSNYYSDDASARSEWTDSQVGSSAAGPPPGSVAGSEAGEVVLYQG